MQYTKTKIVILVTAVVLLASGCSSSGVYMPKHRKHKCNCPTFSQQYNSADEETLALGVHHVNSAAE